MDLHAFFNQFHHLNKPDYELITSRTQSRLFKKGAIIISPGQTQRELFFVENGVQMSYMETDAKVQVIAFTYAPGLCAIPESFCFQKPSGYYLKSLTDSEMRYIAFDVLQQLFDQSQEIERLFRKMTEAILTGMISRHIELQTLSIEELFKGFCKRSPQLLQLVPHKFIASYLGIDATNFSKLYNSIRF
jgi:CRP-like cAMP-binding protein